MSFEYGFYNSIEHDRVYNAAHFSRIFDGIIRDGVFMSVGNHLNVKVNPSNAYQLIVEKGRAWFNSTYNYNDSDMVLDVSPAEPVLNRIDAVVLDINSSEFVRENSIQIIKGVPATSPSNPILTRSEYHNQYVLAYINIGHGVTALTQADITNMVGTSGTPFVTGILETMNIDTLIAQWRSQWANWLTATQNDTAIWTQEQRTNFTNWMANEKAMVLEYISNFESTLDAQQLDFEQWFDRIKDQFDSSQSGSLQNQIDTITETEFNRFYGLIAGTTTINKASNGSTSSIVVESDEATATVTFSGTTAKTITTQLVPKSGNWNYTKIVTIETLSGNKVITTTCTRSAK